ncbi:MAG TPA: iron-containing alcohol dehydrogenase [Solirubrobacteraceae bacterium]|jgi:alcohol dehydrogenase class IV|nr:iron-containing alcohol dehydrogenase [Solirubrobacteraceae bacterium]
MAARVEGLAIPPADGVTPAAHPRVVFGPGAVDALPGAVAALAGPSARTLVVLTASSAGRPWRARLLDGLAPAATEAWEHPSGSPTPETVEATAAAAREHDADVLVAVGGGGVMDAAKAAAALLAAGGARRPGVVTVPTTPGSGAEVTPFATVWDFDAGRKESAEGTVAPAAAIVDPDLSEGVPQPVFAASVLDALTQGAEAAWSTRSTPASRAAGLSAVALVAQAADALFAEAPGAGARTVAALAGLQSGHAIAVSQTTACHALSYPLTARHGVRHGHACVLTLGALLAYNAQTAEADCVDGRGPEHVRSACARVAAALGAPTVPAAALTIDAMRRRAGLAAYDACAADDAVVAAEAATYGRLDNNPRRLDAERLRELLRSLEPPEGARPC